MIARQLKSLLLRHLRRSSLRGSRRRRISHLQFHRRLIGPQPGRNRCDGHRLITPCHKLQDRQRPLIIQQMYLVSTLLIHRFSPVDIPDRCSWDALALDLVSLTGSNIDDAVLQSTTQNLAVAISTILQLASNDPNSNYIAGVWSASAAVPEPSSLLLAGTAGLAGLAGLGRGRADAMGEPSKQKSPLDLDGRRAQRLSVVPILLTFNRRARQLSIPDIGVGALKKRKGTQRLGCLSAPILIAMICIGTGMAYRIAKNPAAVPFTVIAAVALVAAYFFAVGCAAGGITSDSARPKTPTAAAPEGYLRARPGLSRKRLPLHFADSERIGSRPDFAELGHAKELPNIFHRFGKGRANVFVATAGTGP